MDNRPNTQRDNVIYQVLERMKTDRNIMFLSADFGSPVLDRLRGEYPEQFVNVGIAEQNLINIATGMALEGHTVFAYAIAPFLTMRAFEQIRTNLAVLGTVREMNVNLIGVGAGYSYVVSGPTHQCFEDLTIMRSMPNFSVLSPSDGHSAAHVADYCLDVSGLKYLRLDAQPLAQLYDEDYVFSERGFEVWGDGEDGAIVATGYTVHTAITAADILSRSGINVKVVDVQNLRAVAEGGSLARVLRGVRAGGRVVSVEEGFKARGGLDSLLFNYLNDHGIYSAFTNLGVDNGYCFELDSRKVRHDLAHIGVEAVINAFKRRGDSK